MNCRYTESKKAEHVYQEIKVIKEVTLYIFQQWLFVLCAFVCVCTRLDLRTNWPYLKGYLSDQYLEEGIIVSYWTMARWSKHYATLHPCKEMFFVDVPTLNQHLNRIFYEETTFSYYATLHPLQWNIFCRRFLYNEGLYNTTVLYHALWLAF